MLYHLLVPLAKDHILFNVFRYLTFRSFMALITGLVISLVIGPPLIQKLRELQHGGETIREDTPERHRTKKGTPTMGGIVIIVGVPFFVRWRSGVSKGTPTIGGIVIIAAILSTT